MCDVIVEHNRRLRVAGNLPLPPLMSGEIAL